MSLIKDIYFLIYQELDCLSKFDFRLTCKMFSKFKWSYCGCTNYTCKTGLDKITKGSICVKCKFAYFVTICQNLKCNIAKKFDKLIFANFWISDNKICYINKNTNLKIVSIDNDIPYYFQIIINEAKSLLKFERNNVTKFRDYIRLLHFKDMTKNLIKN